MNLNDLAAACVGSINPPTTATLKKSGGYVTAADGSRTPSTNTSTVQIQVQDLSARDLQHLENLNVAGIIRKVYSDAQLVAVDRKAGSGGDLLTFGGDTWLVVHVFESWSTWCSVAVSKQVDA